VGYGVIGSTTDSGSVSLGSSPGTPAREPRHPGARIPSSNTEKHCGRSTTPAAQKNKKLPRKFLAPSSSGLGRRPLKAVARVQIPSGLRGWAECGRRWAPSLLRFALCWGAEPPKPPTVRVPFEPAWGPFVLPTVFLLEAPGGVGRGGASLDPHPSSVASACSDRQGPWRQRRAVHEAAARRDRWTGGWAEGQVEGRRHRWMGGRTDRWR
jgi:hypothetical protein